MKAIILELMACMALTACAVQPASHSTLPDTVQQLAVRDWSVTAPPSSATPASSRDAATDATPETDAQNWWLQFNDPVMLQLVTNVLQQNLDVKAAAERVRQAEAVSVIQHAALLPELNFGATAADARQNIPPPVGDVRQAGFALNANWTPDVFGGQRLQVLAAQAQLGGREQALNTLRLALAANAASAYIDLRWAQAELKILQDNAKIRSDALRLTQKRREFGLSTNLDVARAQNQLSELQARVPGVQSIIEHQLSLIAIYAGRTPESVDQLLATPGVIPAPAATLPGMLPSQALLRRPDVSEAYTVVELRAAQVGVAQAERYPQFSLNLSDGLLAASYLGLPTLTDNLFNVALNATSPIFNAGRITADIAGRESAMRESQLKLRQTLLLALKDIEDSRSDLLSASAQLQQRNDALDASGQALRLSNELYKGGASSFLDVLAAQERYLSDADAVNQANRERALSTVALYRALGGGWGVAGKA